MKNNLLILLMLFAFVPAALAQIDASFTDTSVSITGATPNAPVAVYALMHTFTDAGETSASFADIFAADAAGVVHVDRAVAFQSIWVIVDLSSGAYAVATPRGYVPSRVPVPSATFNAGGQTLNHPRPYLEAFVARPGVGAWHMTAANGRKGDEGAGAGRIRVALKRFARAGSSTDAPDHLTAGDICFVADPDWMQYWVIRLDKNTLPGVTNAP